MSANKSRRRRATAESPPIPQSPARSEQVEGRAPRVPPVLRDLLVGGDQEIAARSRRQITRDGRFKVDCSTEKKRLDQAVCCAIDRCSD